ncbi:hypothetical protein [Lacticaseibacillus absianus]|uniref:hypothetical protein n=1 Tax=Lacticaseibacillus absianus TaxID=2729623 RepID=UPI0015C74A82|nr:hypothetical protein [Lacticaseibacillus absianus]
MKRRKLSLNGWIKLALVVIVVAFVGVHLTPTIAIRYALFKAGEYEMLTTATIRRVPDARAPYEPATAFWAPRLYEVIPDTSHAKDYVTAHLPPDLYEVQTLGLSFATYTSGT